MHPVDPECPQISVLLPAYNEGELIGKSVAAVQASFAEIGWTSYEIIVCNNNSTDNTGELAAAAGARVVFEPHNQISKARNCAAAQARGKWLIFVDADTFLNARLLRRTVECFQAGKICGGGTVIEFDRANLGRFAAGLTWFWNRISAALHLAAGSYVFCYREAWADVGGFEERVYAGEELYFSRKLRAWGRKRGFTFRVFADTPITTSARKLEWYSASQLLWHMARMSLPGAIKRQAACGLWYTRPAVVPSKVP